MNKEIQLLLRSNYVILHALYSVHMQLWGHAPTTNKTQLAMSDVLREFDTQYPQMKKELLHPDFIIERANIKQV